MKTILFLFILMVPMIGISQSNEILSQPLKPQFINGINTDIQLLNPKYAVNNNVPKKLIPASYLAEDKMLLDSFYQVNFNSASDTILFTRRYYEYDENGNEISMAQYNSCKTCVPDYRKEESAYDENGRNTQFINYNWDFAANQWVISRKLTIIYDDKGVMINNTEDYYNNGTIETSVKYAWSHDEHGNVLSGIASMYDVNTGQWVNNSKDEYAYNDSINIHFIYIWDKETSQWIGLDKVENKYDANGNEISKIEYEWNSLTNQWVSDYKVTYTYASNGKQANYTSYKWDSSSNQWIGKEKTDYNYHTSGNKTEEIFSEWNTSMGEWIGQNKYEYIYNDMGLLISPVYYRWNRTTNSWDITNKGDYEYDQQRNMTKATIYSWNQTNSAWWTRSTSKYYYSLHDLTNSLDIFETQRLKLYPNPAHEAFTLEINDPTVTYCQLFDSHGQLIQVMQVEQGINTFKISHLRQGMYLMKIKAEGETIVKKIMKN